MKTIKIITILLILSVALCVNAKKKPEYHRAEIKVSYNYHYHALRHDGEAVTNDHDYLLLANSDYSKYYNYNNEYLDSLNSTPQGMEKAREFAPFGHAGFDPTGIIRLTP